MHWTAGRLALAAGIGGLSLLLGSHAPGRLPAAPADLRAAAGGAQFAAIAANGGSSAPRARNEVGAATRSERRVSDPNLGGSGDAAQEGPGGTGLAEDASALPLPTDRRGVVPSPWWLASGPPVELAIGGQTFRAAPARIDEARLSDVATGDRIALTLPDVGTLEVTVQRVLTPTAELRVLQGHLSDPAEDYPATLTVGPSRTFASISTPTGTFVAEFSEGSGWILLDDREDRLVDHSVSDERIPPPRERS